jgi:hypothetical protein
LAIGASAQEENKEEGTNSSHKTESQAEKPWRYFSGGTSCTKEEEAQSRNIR